MNKKAVNNTVKAEAPKHVPPPELLMSDEKTIPFEIYDIIFRMKSLLRDSEDITIALGAFKAGILSDEHRESLMYHVPGDYSIMENIDVIKALLLGVESEVERTRRFLSLSVSI